MKKVVIVTGGRDYNDRERVFKALTEFHREQPIDILLEGGASGADSLGRVWASTSGVKCLRVSADWANFGKAAGPLRNQRMLDEWQPSAVIAFPGGRGTADMVARATKANVPIRRIT